MNKKSIFLVFSALAGLVLIAYSNGLIVSNQFAANPSEGLRLVANETDVVLDYEKGVMLKNEGNQAVIFCALRNDSQTARSFNLVSSCGCASIVPSSGELLAGDSVEIQLKVKLKPAGKTQTFSLNLIDNGVASQTPIDFSVKWESLFRFEHLKVALTREVSNVGIQLASMNSFPSVDELNLVNDSDWLEAHLILNKKTNTYDLVVAEKPAAPGFNTIANVCISDPVTSLKSFIRIVRKPKDVFVQPNMLIQATETTKAPLKFRVAAVGHDTFPKLVSVKGVESGVLMPGKTVNKEGVVFREFSLGHVPNSQRVTLEFEDAGKCSFLVIEPGVEIGGSRKLGIAATAIADAVASMERQVAGVAWHVSCDYQTFFDPKEKGGFPKQMVVHQESDFHVARLPDGREFSIKNENAELYSKKNGVNYTINVFDGKKTTISKMGRSDRTVESKVRSYQSRDIPALFLDNLNLSKVRHLSELICSSTEEWDIDWEEPVLVESKFGPIVRLNAEFIIREYGLSRSLEMDLLPMKNFALKRLEYRVPDGGGSKLFTSTVVSDYSVVDDFYNIPKDAIETSFNMATGREETRRKYTLHYFDVITRDSFKALQDKEIAMAKRQ